MPYPLRADLPDGTALDVRSSDGIVTLDVAQDSYHCEYAPITEDDVGDDPRARVRLWHDHTVSDAGRIPLITVGRFVAALLHSMWDFHRLSFAGLIAAVSCASAPAGRIVPDPDECQRHVAQFEWLCLFVPFRFRCLFRAYMLTDFLRRHGIDSTWVFGVALFPFEAHCWVVRDNCLLGERAERIARLSPILVVHRSYS